MSLSDKLDAVARSPVLLIACDYDGTLAPIVDDPDRAHPNREALVALSSLATMPQTHVAIISGRALVDLARLTGTPRDVHLVGSHGSEFDPGFAESLSSETRSMRDRVLGELEQIASGGNGFRLETKPASVALHYRGVPQGEAQAALERVMTGPAAYEGVWTKHGKKVVELGVVATHKGDALAMIRHRVGASAAVFLGDDVTDEDAFRTLAGPDVGVKVGEGETAAPYRVVDTHEIARLLAHLSEARHQWLAGSTAVPIQQHSMLSDQRTVALVTPAARIVWYCPPRLDAPALFAELVGGPGAGHFSVIAPGRGEARQRYVGDSLILETRWKKLSVTDYLDCSSGRPGQRAGRCDLIRVLKGTGTARVEFAPRLDFGRQPTNLLLRDDGVEVEDTLDPIVLYAPGVSWRIEPEGPHHNAVAEINLDDGPVTFELRFGTGSLRAGAVPEASRRDQTRRFWSDWARRLRLPTVEPDMVRASALVLRGLCYGPTGAVAAAGTTSLPEHIGGVRNWDYRYCWLRDAALSAHALVRLGSTGEAMRFLDWVLDVIDRCASPERLSPLYTVTGGELGAEAEIADLAGYAGSRPVRVGNAASRQIQLDVFGPIVDLVHSLLRTGAPLSSEHWRLVEAMVGAVAKRWREPDHGIWEIRGPRRHHVHSKVCCWITADRGVQIAEQLRGRTREDWAALRDEIAADILAHGHRASVGAFTSAYDGDDLDAAALSVGLSGLVGPDDDRFVRTVEAVERSLLENGTVYRYLHDDGLPGAEGGFNLCTSWLIDSLVLVGRLDDAWELFSQLRALAGATGLFAEEYDPRTGRALGNHPQAYTHLGFIGNALSLSGTGGE